MRADPDGPCFMQCGVREVARHGEGRGWLDPFNPRSLPLIEPSCDAFTTVGGSVSHDPEAGNAVAG